jgi:hypothetical protein
MLMESFIWFGFDPTSFPAKPTRNMSVILVFLLTFKKSTVLPQRSSFNQSIYSQVKVKGKDIPVAGRAGP